MTATLPIELLRTFHTVIRTGKFSAAANLLHKSPAAVSIHIQRLESVAGGQLLHRDNQSVILTTLGEKLLRSTTELLRSHDRILADLHGSDLAGRIALGMPDEYADRVIREILPSFTTAWPNVVVELRMGPSDELEKLIGRGKLDAAVVVQPKEKTSPEAQLLMSTTPVWVGPLNNNVALESPLPLAVYAAPCIYRQAMTASLKASGLRSRIVLESRSSMAVQACVEAGLAVSLMDRGKVSGRMLILENMPVIPDHNIVFIRSAGSYGDEALDLLSKAFHQSFRL